MLVATAPSVIASMTVNPTSATAPEGASAGPNVRMLANDAYAGQKLVRPVLLPDGKLQAGPSRGIEAFGPDQGYATLDLAKAAAIEAASTRAPGTLTNAVAIIEEQQRFVPITLDSSLVPTGFGEIELNGRRFSGYRTYETAVRGVIDGAGKELAVDFGSSRWWMNTHYIYSAPIG